MLAEIPQEERPNTARDGEQNVSPGDVNINLVNHDEEKARREEEGKT